MSAAWLEAQGLNVDSIVTSGLYSNMEILWNQRQKIKLHFGIRAARKPVPLSVFLCFCFIRMHKAYLNWWMSAMRNHQSD